MASRRRNQEELERLRESFWQTQDSSPAQVIDTYDARAAYERESLSLQILKCVHDYMERENVNQQVLAGRMGVTEGRVSQILSGEQNLTIKTLAAVAAGLRAHFDIQLLPGVDGPRTPNPRGDGAPEQHDQDLTMHPRQHDWAPVYVPGSAGEYAGR